MFVGSRDNCITLAEWILHNMRAFIVCVCLYMCTVTNDNLFIKNKINKCNTHIQITHQTEHL